jgi:hypothetical protein
MKHVEIGLQNGRIPESYCLLETGISQMHHDYVLQFGFWSQRKVWGNEPFFDEIKYQSRAVKLESLHHDLENTMVLICRWLGIKWHENLRKSTFDEKLWWNRPGTLRVSGSNQNIVKQNYTQYLSNFDKFRLANLAYFKYKYWEYKPSFGARAVFYPLIPLLCIFPFLSEIIHLKSRVLFIYKTLQPQLIFFFSQTLSPILQPPMISELLKKQLTIEAGKPHLNLNLLNQLFDRYLKLILLIFIYTYTFSRDYIAIRLLIYKAWKKEKNTHYLVELLREKDVQEI